MPRPEAITPLVATQALYNNSATPFAFDPPMSPSSSPLRRPTLIVAASLLALLLLATGCGRKGDLVRPGQQSIALESTTPSLKAVSALAETYAS